MINRLKNAIQKTKEAGMITPLKMVEINKDVIVRIKKLALAMDGKIDMTFEDNTFKFYRPNGKYFAKNVLGKSDGVIFKTDSILFFEFVSAMYAEKVKSWQDAKKKPGHPSSDWMKPIVLTIGVSDNGYVVCGDYCLDCLEKTEVTMKEAMKAARPNLAALVDAKVSIVSISAINPPVKKQRMVADRPMAVSRPRQRRNEPGNGWRYADALQTRQVLKCKW
ncbi:hypothetical protein FACS189479_05660 [Spirochaetia bacterium]|nr:hypothetical protein FACS189479_05660 [Spirochaetia bacterium]